MLIKKKKKEEGRKQCKYFTRKQNKKYEKINREIER